MRVKFFLITILILQALSSFSQIKKVEKQLNGSWQLFNIEVLNINQDVIDIIQKQIEDYENQIKTLEVELQVVVDINQKKEIEIKLESINKLLSTTSIENYINEINRNIYKLSNKWQITFADNYLFSSILAADTFEGKWEVTDRKTIKTYSTAEDIEMHIQKISKKEIQVRVLSEYGFHSDVILYFKKVEDEM